MAGSATTLRRTSSPSQGLPPCGSTVPSDRRDVQNLADRRPGDAAGDAVDIDVTLLDGGVGTERKAMAVADLIVERRHEMPSPCVTPARPCVHVGCLRGPTSVFADRRQGADGLSTCNDSPSDRVGVITVAVH